MLGFLEQGNFASIASYERVSKLNSAISYIGKTKALVIDLGNREYHWFLVAYESDILGFNHKVLLPSNIVESLGHHFELVGHTGIIKDIEGLCT